MILLIALWGFPLLFVWLMWRRPSNRSVAAFAKTYAVPLTAHNVEQLRRYIQWTRRWRLGGVILATAVAISISMLTQYGGFGWIPFIAGYSAGSLLGELFRPVERVEGSTSIASLERRRVSDFVRPPFVTAAVVVFAASLVPAVFLLLGNPRRRWVDTVDPIDLARSRPQDWFVIGLVAVSVAAAGAALVGGRMVAQAAIPADTPDRLLVRLAIRSATMLALIGGAVLISGSVGAKLGSAAMAIDGGSPTIVQWTNTLTTILCGLSAMWGGIMTLTTIPRLAPLSGRLPTVPRANAHRAA